MNLCRPTYHFMPKNNWMNDPNGPIFVNGEYHLFYQYNPHGDEWGSIHWGHAKSADLVHWEHLPMALFPSVERGEQHCFSGCTVLADGRPVIFYTSIGPGERNATTGAQQWLAYGSADLIHWNKPEENPILTPAIHGQTDIQEWRDPYVWQMAESWFMVCGGTHQGKGCVVLYRSDNLIQWEFLRIVAEGSERIWECPNLFQLNGKWVLTYSPDVEDSRVRYKVGSLTEDFLFIEEFSGILDHGGREGFYAATSFLDDQGRRILLSWMPDQARGTSAAISGWSGVHNLPRVLTLDSMNAQLLMEPISELQTLRDQHWTFSSEIIDGEMVTPIRGKALEFNMVLESFNEEEIFDLNLFCSFDGEEETVIEIDFGKRKLSLDRSRSSLDAGTHHSKLTVDFPAKVTECLELRIFVDHSTVEIFIQSEVCLSARVYPTRQDSEYVYLNSKNGSISLVTFDVWSMKPCLV